MLQLLNIVAVGTDATGQMVITVANPTGLAPLGPNITSASTNNSGNVSIDVPTVDLLAAQLLGR